MESNNQYFFHINNTKCTTILRLDMNEQKKIDELENDKKTSVFHNYLNHKREFVISKKNGELYIKLLFDEPVILEKKQISEKMPEQDFKKMPDQVLELVKVLNSIIKKYNELNSSSIINEIRNKNDINDIEYIKKKIFESNIDDDYKDTFKMTADELECLLKQGQNGGFLYHEKCKKYAKKLSKYLKI